MNKDVQKEILKEDQAKPSAGRSRLKKALRFAAVVAFWLVILSVIQVACIGHINPCGTVPMMVRWSKNKMSKNASTPSQFQWVPIQKVSRNFLGSVWVTEDAKFFKHHGFDWAQIQRARWEAALTGKPSRGASTITQQCARSMFLWQNRSWIRKGLEAYYTVLMELILSKQRILEIYVNVIEFGDGIYGIEAAAQHYYHIPASQLTQEQAAMLTAIMPNPRAYDPLNPTESVLDRKETILTNSVSAAWSWEIIRVCN